MSIPLLTLAIVLDLVGLVFIGQGFGLIPGSFMTNDVRWAAVGIVFMVLAAVLLWQAVRTSRR